MADTQTVPYHWTDEEVQNLFLPAYAHDARVQQYLATGNPPWGIIVHDQILPGVVNDLLVFLPPAQVDHPWWEALGFTPPLGFIQGLGELFTKVTPGKLQVVTVTNLPIVDAVSKAPYKSPDDIGWWEEFLKQLAEAMKKGTEWVPLVIGGFVLIAILQRR